MRMFGAIMLLAIFSLPAFAASVQLDMPANGAAFTASPVQLAYSYIGASGLSCTIYVGGSPVDTQSPPPETSAVYSASVGAGTHSWNVICNDNALGVSYPSPEYTFSVSPPSTPASVMLDLPSDGSAFPAGSTVNIAYSYTGSLSQMWCTVFVNDVPKQPQWTAKEASYVVPASGLPPGTYSFRASCAADQEAASSATSSARTFTIQQPAPTAPNSVNLDLPANNAQFDAGTTTVQLYYSYAGGPSQMWCFLEVGNVAKQPQWTSKETSYVVPASGLSAGTHNWRAKCSFTQEQTEFYVSPMWAFTIKTAPTVSPQVMLGFPDDSHVSYSRDVDLAYSYVANSGPSRLWCTIYLNATAMISQWTDKETSYVVPLKGLATGPYSWRVSCANTQTPAGDADATYNSPTRKFTVYALPPFGTPAVLLGLPEDGEQLPAGTTTVDFAYSFAANGGPSSMWCTLHADGVARLAQAIDKETTYVAPLSGFSAGTHTWNVSCSKEQLSGTPYWSGMRSFSILSPPANPGGIGGSGSSGYFPSSGSGSTGGGPVNRSVKKTNETGTPQTLPPANQTSPPPKVVEYFASLYAPAETYTGEFVQLMLSTDTGRPITGAPISIRFPDGSSLRISTDSAGRASFNATTDGLYTYRVSGYTLAGNPQTKAIAKSPDASKPANDDLANMLNMALPFVGALLVIAILAGGYMFLTRKKEE